MNREEILNKYIDLIDKGYCCDCNELNCIDNFPHAKITHAIKELQQENQSLKKENKILRENAEHNDKVVDKVNWENLKLKNQLEEYKRLGFEHLNDKCNKLENQQKGFIEFLENEKDRCLTFYSSAECMYAYDVFKDVLSKYKEIIEK